MTDYPVGPDDAGNAVMHGIGFLVTGWHRIVGRFTSPERRRMPEWRIDDKHT